MGGSLDFRPSAWLQARDSIRPGLSQDWMPALERAAGGSKQSEIRAMGRNKARMRHSYFFEESRSMNFLIGFMIALAVGLTGIGGGSFTVPAPVLIVWVTARQPGATAFVFGGRRALIAPPFCLLS